MRIELDSFLNNTENSNVSLSPKEEHGLQYPFVYLTEITNVEIAHLIDAGVLHKEALTQESLQLFLKTDGYRLLGYIELTFETVLHLNYLREHNIWFKASKGSEMSITQDLFDSILLTG